MKSTPAPAPLPGALRPRLSARARLRNYFLTGLIVGGPLAITLYITWWFIKLVDAWVKPVVPAVYLPETYLPFPIPGFGLIVAFTALTILGFLTANLYVLVSLALLAGLPLRQPERTPAPVPAQPGVPLSRMTGRKQPMTGRTPGP